MNIDDLINPNIQGLINQFVEHGFLVAGYSIPFAVVHLLLFTKHFTISKSEFKNILELKDEFGFSTYISETKDGFIQLQRYITKANDLQLDWIPFAPMLQIEAYKDQLKI